MVLVTKPKRPTSVRHQKHHGQHQKQTKHFMNIYWPYLPLILVVGVGLLINSNLSRQHSGVLGYSTDVSTSSLLTNTNTERQHDNEQSLNINAQLDKAAQAKANDMAVNNYWSHNTPSGVQPWVFIQQAGYNYTTVGENLAYGFNSSSAVLAAWMSSTAHRDNILNSSYQDVGFGIANATNFQGNGPETIIVAMYGQPASADVIAVNEPQANSTELTQVKLVSQKVTWIQLITGNRATWSVLVVSLVAALAFMVFIIRHGLIWKRVVTQGETFIINHPWLDILIVTVGMASFILSRTAGIIG